VSEVILVDGYNVIHAVPRLAALLKESLEAARERLVAWLLPLSDLGEAEVLVVFDAAKTGRPAVEVEERGRLRVLYSRRGQSADGLIEELSRRLASAYRVTVVTADRPQGRLAFFQGASVIDASRLLDRADEARREMSALREEGAGRMRAERDRLEDRVPEEVRRLLDRMRYR